MLAIVICAAPAAPPDGALQAQRPAVPPQAWLFTWSITPTANGQAVSGGALVLDVAIWKGMVRIGVREGPLRALTGDGGTLLLNATDSSLAIVKPARREVLSAGIGDLGTLMGAPGNAIPIEVSDVSSVTRARGIGVALNVYRTTRVELTQRYALAVSTPTIRRTIHTQQVHDLEISRDVARLDPGFRVFAAQFARAFGVPGAVRAKLHALERAIPDGVPVRTTTTAITASGSDTLRTVTRSEMIALRRETVDSATFFVPAGYRVTEMSRLLQQRKP